MSSGHFAPRRSSNESASRRRLRLKLNQRPLLEPLESRELLTIGTASEIEGTLKAAGLLGAHPIHELKKKVPKPAIKAAVTAGPDAAGSVTVSGTTYPKAKVTLDVNAD